MTIAAFLRKIPLFAELKDDNLEELCQMVQEVRLTAGTLLFTESDPGDNAYVIKEGQIEIIKTSSNRDVLLAVLSSGDVIGEMALIESLPRTASARARDDCVLLAISKETLDQLFNASPSAARSMLHTIAARLRATEGMLGQSEKMAQLGTLTAGITHDLNNPSTAVLRGSEQLLVAILQLQQAQMEISRLGLSPSQAERLIALYNQVEAVAVRPIALDPLERSDRQNELEKWLEANQIEKSWEVANHLANMEWEVNRLIQLSEEYSVTQLPNVIELLAADYTISTILQEIKQGAHQISEIVKALKNYVYLDQAPVQPVDIHEGLENTLVILKSKLKMGVMVERDYAPNLPRVFAYGSELNQVWTNLIDNAIDALLGAGEPEGEPTGEKVADPRIILRTFSEGDWVVIEVEDNGPGIVDEIQSKIFTPFFTTKALGTGTGLGLNNSLNIIQKHGGEITVRSQPGCTVFNIRIPIK